jgi:hypothetical protein
MAEPSRVAASLTRLNEPPERLTERDRRHRETGEGPRVGSTPPAERQRVRTSLLEDEVVLPQVVDVWLASWELEAEFRQLDSTAPGYWDAGARWIRATCLRPD